MVGPTLERGERGSQPNRSCDQTLNQAPRSPHLVKLRFYTPPLDKIEETTQIAEITLSGVQCIVNTVKADGQRGEQNVDRHGSLLLVNCEPDS